MRDYGPSDFQIGREATPEAFTATLVEVFREVKRVLRPDGTLWVNLGDSYSRGSRGTVPEQRGQCLSTADAKKYRFTSPAAKLGKHPTIKPKDLIGIPWRVAFALQEDGWFLRQDIIWSKPACRPESIQDRCTKAHEYIFLLAHPDGGGRYYFDSKAIREPTRNRLSVWNVHPRPYPGAHFAVWPRELVQMMVLAGCPVGGVVLDPFSGSATTGAVALSLGRNYIGTDLNAAYLDLAKARLYGWKSSASPDAPKDVASTLALFSG